jgi:SAM-dependent methyltransferase
MKTKPELVSAVDGTYDALAAEYYDVERHPTCANFRWGSERLLERVVPGPPDGLICEVGAGDSVLAALLARKGHSLAGLLLTDASLAMLMYSKRWADQGARLEVAAASALPVRDGSVDLLVASLGDPFDCQSWWAEAARVLAPRGQVVLTTPAAGWATGFRGAVDEPSASARFVLADGAVVDVPSYVREPDQERMLIAGAGLRVTAEDAVLRSDLPTPVSAKLDWLAPEDPVVFAYVATHR